MRAQGADARVAEGGRPGRCVGRGLEEGTHVGVSERGEEGGGEGTHVTRG